MGQINGDRLSTALELPVPDTGPVEHHLGCPHRVTLLILVRHIDYLFDAGLDNHLGTFVARKEPHIDAAIVQLMTDGVQNSIDLGMTHIRVLRIQEISFPSPG